MYSHLRSRPSPALALGTALLVSIAACGGGDGNGGNGNGTTDPPTTGSLRATVNVDGTATSGVTVRVFDAGGSNPTATQTTANDGTTTFTNLDAGSHDVEVTPPSGAVVPPSEQARKTVSVIAGQTAQLSFALASDIGDVVEVEVQNNLTFSPAELTIEAGTTVRWRSTSAMLHTVTPDGHSAWTSATLGGVGDTFTFTFDQPGTYAYYCEPHLSSNMRGTVIVE